MITEGDIPPHMAKCWQLDQNRVAVLCPDCDDYHAYSRGNRSFKFPDDDCCYYIEPGARPRVHVSPPIRSANGAASYVRNEIEKEVDRLLAAPEGIRNHTLFEVGRRFFEFVAGGHLPAGSVEAALIEGAERLGIQPDEYRKTIESAKEHGSANPVEFLIVTTRCRPRKRLSAVERVPDAA